MSRDRPGGDSKRSSSEDAGRSDWRPAEEQSAVPSAHFVLWGAVGGWLLGLVVLFGDYSTWDKTSRELANDGPFVLWTIALAAQTMAWVLALPLIHAIWRRRRSRAAARGTEMRAATLALLLFGSAVAFVPLLTGSELPATVPHRSLKLTLLNVAGFAIAIYAARAIWYAVYELRRLGASSAADLSALERHRSLRVDLEHLLGVLGALVSLGVIASAGLHALTVHVDPDDALPVQSVIAYGTREVGDPSFGERLDERARLDHFLGLDVSAGVRFRGAVVILGPLLGSLTSLIPELGG